MCLFLVNHSLIHFYQERGSNFYACNSDMTIQVFSSQTVHVMLSKVGHQGDFVENKLVNNAVWL